MNLSSLGVPQSMQNRPPTGDSFPLAFNQNTAKYWPIAVGQVKTADPTRAWVQTIDRFIEICRKNSTYPFHQLESKNDLILTELIKYRRQVVKFIERHGLIEILKPYSARREVTMTPTGFGLKVDASAKLTKEDPTFIQVMGLRQANGRWERQLDKRLTFYLMNEGARLSGRWHFGYEITVDVFPSIPGHPTATTTELENFILKIMYLPILRCYRPVGGLTNLI